MPWNALLLALVGGYLFCRQWNRSRYTVNRADGQRLLLEASLWGVLLLIISFFTVRLLCLNFPAFHLQWRSFIQYPNVGTPLGALMLGLLAPRLLNRFFHENLENIRSYDEFSDYFGTLLFQSQLTNGLICADLKNGKVYIGIVKKCNSPGRHDTGGSILLQPYLSGYRNKDTHELVLRTDYTHVNQLISKDLEEARSTQEQAQRALEDTKKPGNDSNRLSLSNSLEKANRIFDEALQDANEKLDCLIIAISTSELMTVRPFNLSLFEDFMQSVPQTTTTPPDNSPPDCR